MSITESVSEMKSALSDRSLIPVFKEGETLIVQRDVNGRNVLMTVTVSGPCSLSPDRMVLTARPKIWGVSSYADGRVANQAASIQRLMDRINRAVKIAEKHPDLDAVNEILSALLGAEEEVAPPNA